MKFVWLFILAILCAACAATPATPSVSTPNISAVAGQGYPVSETNQAPLQTAYPAQPDESATQLPTQTIDPNLGIVKGVLLQQGKPVAGADLYIADLLQSAEGQDVAYQFFHGTSPRSVTNEKGEFEFRNVPHGTHGLIFDKVFQSYLLLKPNTQDAMKFDTGPGIVVDLGVLDYDELPLD